MKRVSRIRFVRDKKWRWWFGCVAAEAGVIETKIGGLNRENLTLFLYQH